ncbi:hypothetical protein EVAR_27798_1 [Eumeta japonica]|uniref:Uncharacterized protein n=1 Tax=Eumeta variegata TaxID=151549 RepID=A0A4C1VJP5_EUMVA|nr:hypothetical protein EVAR_27798_1 [Eumeta japonica]
MHDGECAIIFNHPAAEAHSPTILSFQIGVLGPYALRTGTVGSGAADYRGLLSAADGLTHYPIENSLVNSPVVRIEPSASRFEDHAFNH